MNNQHKFFCKLQIRNIPLKNCAPNPKHPLCKECNSPIKIIQKLKINLSKKNRHKDIIEEKTICFAKKIIPPNWNICTDTENFVLKPGSLNILLYIVSDRNPYNFLQKKGCCFMGRIKGSMKFQPNKTYKEKILNAKDIIRKYGEGHIGLVNLEIWPGYQLEETLVHELAHIADLRYKALKQKDRNIIGCIILNGNEDITSHDSWLFLKAYRRMIIRTENAYGKKATKKMRIEYKMLAS